MVTVEVTAVAVVKVFSLEFVFCLVLGLRSKQSGHPILWRIPSPASVTKSPSSFCGIRVWFQFGTRTGQSGSPIVQRIPFLLLVESCSFDVTDVYPFGGIRVSFKFGTCTEQSGRPIVQRIPFPVLIECLHFFDIVQFHLVEFVSGLSLGLVPNNRDARLFGAFLCFEGTLSIWYPEVVVTV